MAKFTAIVLALALGAASAFAPMRTPAVSSGAQRAEPRARRPKRRAGAYPSPRGSLADG